MRLNRFVTLSVVFGFLAGMSSIAFAVPYASALRDMDGAGVGQTWEFVLNESADGVTVLRDGGNAVSLGAIAAGRYTFDMTGFSTFDIQVGKDASVGWTELSSSSNLFTSFHRPTGMAVNTDPASPYFGTIYVGNSNPLLTAAGRTTGDGIYALTANMIGVDLSTGLAVADANDATQAKAPGFSVGADGPLGHTNSPYRFSLDEAGNLIIGDWSDANGGIKYASPNLTTGGLVLALEDGVRPLFLDPGTNTHEMHGSIVARPQVTGSVGNGLTVYAIDEDFDVDMDTFTDPDGGGTIPAAQFGNSLWRWDVGNATSYEGAPVLTMASNAANLAADPVRYFSLNIGVSADAHYNADNDNWYISQSRTNGNESSLIIIDADGAGAAMADPNNPTVLWSSKGYSVANNLDGFTDNPAAGQEATIGINDIFREAHTVAFSPDGSTMFLQRSAVYSSALNPILGASDNGGGAVLVIPLDANGVPDLTINDNGTPGDTSDDIITNITTITTAIQGFRHAVAETYLDAAGNLYTARANTTATPTAVNSAQRLQVFSPGGNWLATTTGNTTVGNTAFSLVPVVPGLPGDFNDDGTVNTADFVMWSKNEAANGALPNDNGLATQAERYTLWMTHFGESDLGSGGSSNGDGSVPEPTTAMLVMVSLLVAGCGCRRRA